MSKEYDKIIKENIEAIILPLIDKLLGIHPKTIEEIPDALQTTIEREPDLLKKVVDIEGNVFILHIEFQVKDERMMVLRMLEYKSILLRKHELPIRQFVLFMGKGKAKMPRRLSELIEDKQLQFRFDVLNIYDIPHHKLLESDIPEEIILAILCNFSGRKAVEVIKDILDKLERIADDEIKLQRYVKQLSILSKMRNLNELTISKIKTMPIYFDIEKDYVFQKGIEKGIEKEKVQNIKNLILNSDWTDEKIATIFNTDIKLVQKIRAELKDSK